MMKKAVFIGVTPNNQNILDEIDTIADLSVSVFKTPQNNFLEHKFELIKSEKELVDIADIVLVLNFSSDYFDLIHHAIKHSIDILFIQPPNFSCEQFQTVIKTAQESNSLLYVFKNVFWESIIDGLKNISPEIIKIKISQSTDNKATEQRLKEILFFVLTLSNSTVKKTNTIRHSNHCLTISTFEMNNGMHFIIEAESAKYQGANTIEVYERTQKIIVELDKKTICSDVVSVQNIDIQENSSKNEMRTILRHLEKKELIRSSFEHHAAVAELYYKLNH